MGVGLDSGHGQNRFSGSPNVTACFYSCSFQWVATVLSQDLGLSLPNFVHLKFKLKSFTAILRCTL